MNNKLTITIELPDNNHLKATIATVDQNGKQLSKEFILRHIVIGLYELGNHVKEKYIMPKKEETE